MTLRRWSILLPFLLLLGVPAGTSCADSPTGGGCCKVCKTGKACGDSCISKSDTCHVGAGCACNG
jgi:hypothetical protein